MMTMSHRQSVRVDGARLIRLPEIFACTMPVKQRHGEWSRHRDNKTSTEAPQHQEQDCLVPPLANRLQADSDVPSRSFGSRDLSDRRAVRSVHLPASSFATQPASLDSVCHDVWIFRSNIIAMLIMYSFFFTILRRKATRLDDRRKTDTLAMSRIRIGVPLKNSRRRYFQYRRDY